VSRRFEHANRVLLADAAPDGRARFDAIARWLQDAAYLDVVDAGVDGMGAWIVRRTRLEVSRFPVFGEPLRVVTWCSGLGKMWAERRTTVTGERGGQVEATALWVFLDAGTGRPQPLPPDQLAVWAESAGDRRVRARLHHDDPPADAPGTPWRFRASDLDVAGHVNNAAYWEVLEDDLAAAGSVPEPVVAEVEHRGAASAGVAQVRRAQERWWVCAPGGSVHASITLTMDA
jgi:acyl-ACP thioesterase